MPKTSFALKRFLGGVFTSPDPADVPMEGAAAASDVDVEPRGFLRGRFADVKRYSGDALEAGFAVDVPFEGGSENSVVGFDPTTDEVAYFGPFDGATAEERFSVSDDFGYGVGAHPTGIVLPPATATAFTTAGTDEGPYWIGPFEHEQFGDAADLTLNVTQGSVFTEANIVQAGIVTFSIGTVTTGVSDNIEQGYLYFYTIALVWDGFQESNLYQLPETQEVNVPTASIDIDLNWETPGSQTAHMRRISHVNIYRARAAWDGSGAEPTEPDTAYRLLESVDVDDATWGTSGSDRTYSATDDGSAVGTTFEESSGLPETLQAAYMSYTLATVANERLFVGNCAHELVERAEFYVFASLPYRYGVFHWARDAVVLPERPVRLVAFGSSVFALCGRSVHQIDADTLTLTRTEEGVGCASKFSAAAGPDGVLFADSMGVYFHDGTRAYRVSTAIDRSQDDADGWQDATHTTGPFIQWHARFGAFVVVYEKTATPTYAGFVYTPPRRSGAVTVDGSGAVGTTPADGQWRPFSLSYSAVYGMVAGPYGEVHLSVLDAGTKRLVALFGHGSSDLGSGTRDASWSWTTPIIDLKAEAGARTKLYRLEVAGTGLDGLTAEVAYNGGTSFSSLTMAAGNDGTYFGEFPAVGGKRPVEGRVQLRISGDADCEVSSVVVFHRPLMTRTSTTIAVA